MKVAIAALGNSVDAAYARHFATATHYFIYDTETGEVEVMENTARNLPAGRGVTLAETLIKKGVKAVVVELIGPKPFNMLRDAEVKVYPGPKLKVQDVLNAVKAGELASPLTAPTEEPHAGEHGACEEEVK
jgi:predicted Fe-Mo cluster-binding NifX family protein